MAEDKKKVCFIRGFDPYGSEIITDDQANYLWQ
jgi:hypothetical protein